MIIHQLLGRVSKGNDDEDDGGDEGEVMEVHGKQNVSSVIKLFRCFVQDVYNMSK